MNVYAITFMCLLLVPGIAAAVDAPAGIPVYYFGWVRVNGSLASDGTTVTAESSGQTIGSAVVPTTLGSGSGYYHIYVNSSFSNQTVTFKVNGVTATTLILPEKGSASMLNLSATVTSSGSTTGASGSGGTGGGAELAVSETRTLGPVSTGESARLEFTEDVVIKSMIVKVREDFAGGSITVRKEIGKPDETTTPTDIVYEYIDITSTDGLAVDEITMEFSVSTEWLGNNNINRTTVSLNRYVEVWQPLPTELVEEENNAVTYRSTTPGLSVFVVTGKTATTCNQGELRCTNSRLERCDGTWQMVDECIYGCSEDSCLVGPENCTEGQKRCSGNAAQVCSNGTWTDEACSGTCSNGVCIEATATESYLGYVIAAIVLATIVLFIIYRRIHNQ